MALVEAIISLIGTGFFLLVVLIVLVVLFVRIVYEYQRGIKFTLGKFSSIMSPGLNTIIPIFQTMQKVDIRTKTVDIPKQEVMTRDNIPVKINAVVYFNVEDPKKAILNIQDYIYAVAQYAQTALRDVIGARELDEVLVNRDEIANQIEKIVDKETDAWGINVTGIRVQDVELPADLKRTMAKQAEAEREKRAVIIKAEGELIASKNISDAAIRLAKTPGGLHLRTLHTLNDLSSDQSNTVVFAIPIEILDAIRGIAEKKGNKKK